MRHSLLRYAAGVSILAIFIFCASTDCAGQDTKPAEDTAIMSAVSKDSAEEQIKSGGGRIATHMVDRGESWEFIAARYRTTPEMLRKLNPGFDICYAGLEINVPDYPHTTDSRGNHNNTSSFRDLEQESLYRQAEAEFKRKEYGKAAKLYGKIIKKEPSATAYYNRGLCQYNRRKWRQAADDLSAAKYHSEATEEMKEKCTELIKVARHNHEVWAQNRNNIIGAAILGTLAVGATTYAAVEMSKSDSKSRTRSKPATAYPATYSGVSSRAAATHTANTDMNSVMNALMEKTFRDSALEEQQFKANYRMSCPWATEEDVNNAYFNYLSVKYGSASGTQSSDDGKTHKERKRRILNTTVGDKCTSCHGTGKCSACGGTKVASRLGVTYYCETCSDKGICTVCHGTGKNRWERD